MVKKLEDSMEMFGGDVSALVTSPATNRFSKVRKDSKQLSDNKGQLFHSVVANVLFIMKRSRSDLDMSMGFLTKRISKSDVGNW